MNKILGFIMVAAALLIANIGQSQTITPSLLNQPTIAMTTISSAQLASVVTVTKNTAGLTLPSGTVSSVVLSSNVVTVRIGAVSITKSLTSTESGSLLATVISPPAGAGYSVIALPAGKTVSGIKMLAASARPDGFGGLILRF